MLLELTDSALLDVDESGSFERVPECLRVVDERVPPRAEEVVDDRARERRVELRLQRLGCLTHVALPELAAVVQLREAFERRRRDTERSAWT